LGWASGGKIEGVKPYTSWALKVVKNSKLKSDPISVLFLTGGIEHAPPFKSDNFEQRPLFFLLSLVLALPEIIV